MEKYVFGRNEGTNEAVVRGRHSISIADELLSNTNASNVFSKLDLNGG